MMDWGDSRRPAKAVLKRSCSAYSIASSTDFFAEEIQPAVAMGFGGGWMRRKFPALIPVAGNHFGPGDGSGRLFRLGLENEPIRQALFGFVKVRRAETNTLGPVAFPPAAIPSGAACPLPKPATRLSAICWASPSIR